MLIMRQEPVEGHQGGDVHEGGGATSPQAMGISVVGQVRVSPCFPHGVDHAEVYSHDLLQVGVLAKTYAREGCRHPYAEAHWR